MIAEKQSNTPAQSSTMRKLLPWLNLGLAVALVAVGIWYLADKVSLAEVARALALAHVGYIALGVAVMVVTVLLKAWRWQLLLTEGETRPSFAPLFWSMMLGQYINLIVPFLRLGELARIVTLHQQTGISRGRSLGTLLIEKALDLIFFALTIAVLLPFVILPTFVGDPGLALGVVSLVVLLLLYLLAYQTESVTRILQSLAERVPLRLSQRLLQLAISGLQGLSALRSRKLTLLLLLSSAVIAFLAALLPYVLFPAFGLNLGLVAGTLMHVVVSVVSAPPSTPAKIGVFNGVAVFMLYRLGVTDDAAIVGYAIVFHLVVILPQIVLGGIAASRTKWRWQKAADSQVLS